jgi:CubicO group peptidase (beta-lactamase class C family)
MCATTFQPSGNRVDLTTTAQFRFVDGPDTGLYSTAGDMLRFVTALRSGKLLDRDFLSLATGGGIPVVPKDPSVSHCSSDTVSCTTCSTSATSRLDDFQDLGWVAVVLSNHDREAVDAIVRRQREIVTRRGIR